MISRKELIANRSKLESKAMGCMAGLAIGDALGDIGRTQEFRQRYGIVTNMYEWR